MDDIVERLSRLEERVRYLEESYRRLEKKLDNIYSVTIITLSSIITLIVVELIRFGAG